MALVMCHRNDVLNEITATYVLIYRYLFGNDITGDCLYNRPILYEYYFVSDMGKKSLLSGIDRFIQLHEQYDFPFVACLRSS